MKPKQYNHFSNKIKNTPKEAKDLILWDYFNDFVKQFDVYPNSEIFTEATQNAKRKKLEKRCNDVLNETYKFHALLHEPWRQVDLDYFMAYNDVIVNELINDVATMSATIDHMMKEIKKHYKKEQLIKEWYDERFKCYDKSLDEIRVGLVEDLITIHVCIDENSPVNIKEQWSIPFYKKYKEVGKQLRVK